MYADASIRLRYITYKYPENRRLLYTRLTLIRRESIQLARSVFAGWMGQWTWGVGQATGTERRRTGEIRSREAHTELPNVFVLAAPSVLVDFESFLGVGVEAL